MCMGSCYTWYSFLLLWTFLRNFFSFGVLHLAFLFQFSTSSNYPGNSMLTTQCVTSHTFLHILSPYPNMCVNRIVRSSTKKFNILNITVISKNITFHTSPSQFCSQLELQYFCHYLFSITWNHLYFPAS